MVEGGRTLQGRFPTVAALEGFLSGVDSWVLPETGAVREGLPGAAWELPHTVSGLLLSEAKAGLQVHATLPTHEGVF